MATKKQLRQRKAIPLLLLGKTDTEVAEEIGVSRQTIWKWQREEDFDHDIVEAGEELLAQHTVAISELVKKSLSAMSDLLEDADNDLKLKVASTVLNAAKEWKRPEAPGHTAARSRLDEEQLKANSQISNWESQFIAQGGKPEDFVMAMATGKFDPRAEIRAKIDEMNSSDTPDSDSNQNGSGETR